MLELDSTRAL